MEEENPVAPFKYIFDTMVASYLLFTAYNMIPKESNKTNQKQQIKKQQQLSKTNPQGSKQTISIQQIILPKQQELSTQQLLPQIIIPLIIQLPQPEISKMEISTPTETSIPVISTSNISMPESTISQTTTLQSSTSQVSIPEIPPRLSSLQYKIPQKIFVQQRPIIKNTWNDYLKIEQMKYYYLIVFGVSFVSSLYWRNSLIRRMKQQYNTLLNMNNKLIRNHDALKNKYHNLIKQKSVRSSYMTQNATNLIKIFGGINLFGGLCIIYKKYFQRTTNSHKKKQNIIHNMQK